MSGDRQWSDPHGVIDDPELAVELEEYRADLLAAEVEHLRKLVAKLRWRLQARSRVVRRATCATCGLTIAVGEVAE